MRSLRHSQAKAAKRYRGCGTFSPKPPPPKKSPILDAHHPQRIVATPPAGDRGFPTSMNPAYANSTSWLVLFLGSLNTSEMLWNSIESASSLYRLVTRTPTSRMGLARTCFIVLRLLMSVFIWDPSITWVVVSVISMEPG